MKIAWWRGFFRLWIVLSVCWVAGVGIIAFNYIGSNDTDFIPDVPSADPKAAPALPSDVIFPDAQPKTKLPHDIIFPPAPPFDPAKPYEVVSPQKSYSQIAMWTVVPPACLLVFGLAFWWIAKGFRQQ